MSIFTKEELFGKEGQSTILISLPGLDKEIRIRGLTTRELMEQSQDEENESIRERLRHFRELSSDEDWADTPIDQWPDHIFDDIGVDRAEAIRLDNYGGADGLRKMAQTVVNCVVDPDLDEGDIELVMRELGFQVVKHIFDQIMSFSGVGREDIQQLVGESESLNGVTSLELP